MKRFQTATCCLFLCALVLSGCGGEKFDYTIQPKSYALKDLVPAAVGDVVVSGIARDGRLVGSYLKESGKPMQPFGWTSDGETNDFTLPTQCKQIDSINEIGQVVCSDQTVAPPNVYVWQSSSLGKLDLPASTTKVKVNAMSFAAGVASTVTASGKDDAVILNSDEKPKSTTTSGYGAFNGCSQNGNLCGSDKASGVFVPFVVIANKRTNLSGLYPLGAEALSINDSGTCVGYSLEAGNVQKAFTWKDGHNTALSMVSGATDSVALDINNDGVICGKQKVAGTWEACVWFPGKSAVLLKSLSVVPSGVVLNEARVITPLGMIVVGVTKKISGVDHSGICSMTPSY